MGYEPFAFIPDPEAGLKEGEEPPPPPTVEEADPDLLKYRGLYRQEDLRIHVTPEWREAATRDPFTAAWVSSWDWLARPSD
jgi:hypothetical protein